MELIRRMADMLREYVKESGPCDHAVNICICEINNLIFEADIELGNIKKCTACGGDGSYEKEENDPDYGWQIIDVPCIKCGCSGYIKLDRLTK